MRELILVVQTSLDGFVAGSQGEFDHFAGGEENLEFVCSLTDQADAALFGRVTYELLDSYWPTAAGIPNATKNTIHYSNWYKAVSKIVLSRTLPRDNSKNIQVINENVRAEIKKLKQQAGKSILLFGSPSIVHQLLESDLLDAIWMIVHPVIFGSGIALFREGKKVIKLELASAHQLSNGTLCNKYLIHIDSDSKKLP